MEQSVVGLIALFLRCSGCILFIPLARNSHSGLKKLLLSLGLLAVAVQLPLEFDIRLTPTLCISEVLIGMAASLPLRLLLQGLEMFGEYLDIGRGQSIASFYDSSVAHMSSQSASLLRSYGLAAFTSLGALELIFGSFLKSVIVFPPGSLELSRMLEFAPELSIWLCGLLLHFIHSMLPLCIIFLAVDFSLSILARGASQGFLFSESFFLKTFLGFGVLIASLLYSGLSSSWYILLQDLLSRSPLSTP